MSIMLSSTFLDSFGLAKYSFNPFLLLSILFFIRQDTLEMHTESGLAVKCVDGRGQTLNISDFGRLELPEWCGTVS